MTEQQAYCTYFTDYPDMVNVPQMCAMLGGISTKTGYKLLRNNDIPSFKLGKGYAIPKRNILFYLKLLSKEQE